MWRLHFVRWWTLTRVFSQPLPSSQKDPKNRLKSIRAEMMRTVSWLLLRTSGDFFLNCSLTYYTMLIMLGLLGICSSKILGFFLANTKVYGFFCGLALMGALMGCGDDSDGGASGISYLECATFSKKLSCSRGVFLENFKLAMGQKENPWGLGTTGFGLFVLLAIVFLWVPGIFDP